VIFMSGRIFNVLFLCTGNSARSILAECLLRQLGKGSFNSFSAGSFPKGQVHPVAIQLLVEQGFSAKGLRSKSWNEFAAPGAPAMDFVFTVCDQAAGEVCPVWPGQPVTAHWGIPDPAAVDGSEAERMLAFRDAFHALERRIKIFISLPIDKLDRIALTKQVEAIGRLRPDAAEGRAS
jgi:arsenate reductase